MLSIDLFDKHTEDPPDKAIRPLAMSDQANDLETAQQNPPLLNPKPTDNQKSSTDKLPATNNNTTGLLAHKDNTILNIDVVLNLAKEELFNLVASNTSILQAIRDAIEDTNPITQNQPKNAPPKNKPPVPSKPPFAVAVRESQEAKNIDFTDTSIKH
ncbi:hypothetical protein HAX54_012686, partial [Datura stramonium]|nr:hypothetical protein [Datura stramonium]